ncbi:hypothetical protein PENTCL1PPCAC_16477, partial [Pristionchus entomophagus]
MLGGLISEELLHLYSYITTSCSLICNYFLIFVLIFTELNHLLTFLSHLSTPGCFRWLLFSFGVVGILTSLIHTWMFPAAHMTEFGYNFWGYRFLDKSTTYGVVGSLVWCFLFYQSFVLLAFHYVYRYVILVNPPWLILMRLNPWRNWVTVAVIADLFYGCEIVYLVKIDFANLCIRFIIVIFPLQETYGIDLYSGNLPGYLCLTYWIRSGDGHWEWTWIPVLSMLLTISIIFTAVVAIVFCIFRIIREMRKVLLREHVESNTRRMQRRLVRALIWQ